MTIRQLDVAQLKQTILSTLNDEISLDDLLTAVDSTYRTIDEVIKQWLSNSDDKPACQSGCGYCCSQAVWITEPEAIYLAEAIRRHHPPLIERAVQYNEITKSMDMGERVRTPVACPFLYEDGTCWAYDVRPIVCRYLYSYSRDACIAGLQGQTNQIPVFPTPIKEANEIRSALLASLHDKGLYCHTLDFNAALTVCAHNSSAGERWLAGENTFENAIASEQVIDITAMSRFVSGDL